MRSDQCELMSRMESNEVLIIGPGFISSDDEKDIASRKKKGALVVGIGWAPLKRTYLDVLVTGHSAHMLTTYIGFSEVQLKIHAIPYPLFPLFRGSEVVRRVNVNSWTDKEIQGYIEQHQCRPKKCISDTCPTFHNAIFLGIFLAMMNGAKKASLYGFDPLRPDYLLDDEALRSYLSFASISNGIGLDYLLFSNKKKPEEARSAVVKALEQKTSQVGGRASELAEKMQRMHKIADSLGFIIDLRGESLFFSKVKSSLNNVAD